MPRKNKKNHSTNHEIIAKVAREAYVSDMKEGRRQRANTFATGKGRGSYDRKNKYNDYED